MIHCDDTIVNLLITLGFGGFRLGAFIQRAVQYFTAIQYGLNLYVKCDKIAMRFCFFVFIERYGLRTMLAD